MNRRRLNRCWFTFLKENLYNELINSLLPTFVKNKIQLEIEFRLSNCSFQIFFSFRLSLFEIITKRKRCAVSLFHKFE